MTEKFNIYLRCNECNYPLGKIKSPEESVLYYTEHPEAFKKCPKHPKAKSTFIIKDSSGKVYPIQFFNKPSKDSNISTETI